MVMEFKNLKSFIVTLSVLLGLFYTTNCAYSFDREKLEAISEIGLLSNSQKYEVAMEKCNAAMEKYPDDPELYYWKATINSNLGNGQEALEDISRAVELNPKDSNVYVMRGIMKSEIGDNEGALVDFDKALTLNPNNDSAYAMRACIKVLQGDLKSAKDDLEIANKLLDEEEKSIEKEQEQEFRE